MNGRARDLAAILLVLVLSGCGSSGADAGKQARIAAALHKFESELIVGKREAPREFRGKDLLGSLTLVYEAPPHGVSAAEWNAALKRDRRLQRLLNK